MSPDEMSRFVMHLMEQLDAIREELRVTNAEQKRLNDLVLSLTNQLHDAQQTITNLTRKNEDLQSPSVYPRSSVWAVLSRINRRFSSSLSLTYTFVCHNN